MSQSSLPEELAQQAIAAFKAHGSTKAAADALGIARTTLQSRIYSAARMGLLGTDPVLPGFSLAKVTVIKDADGNITQRHIHQKPAHGEQFEIQKGQRIKGISALVDAEGREIIKWVKTGEDRDWARDFAREAIAAFKEEVPPAEPRPAPVHVLDHLLNQYTITDSHFGLLAWHEEGGADYDLKIAENLLLDWFAAAIEASPRAHTAILAQLGDLLHYDSMRPETPLHRHVLDSDSRFQKIVRIVLRVLRRIIPMLLDRHQEVVVIMAQGNHDPASAVWLKEALAIFYENEPRIRINTSPLPYFAEEWGDTALFYHHGDQRGIKDVDKVFAGQFRELFGRAKQAYAHIGHLHSNEGHKTELMYVERHETLAARDAFASWKGFQSGRSAKVITYSKSSGEVFRSTLRPDMVAGKYAVAMQEKQA